MVYSLRPFFVSDLAVAQPMKRKGKEISRVRAGSRSASVVFVFFHMPRPANINNSKIRGKKCFYS